MSLQVLLADTPELRETIYALRYVIYVEEMVLVVTRATVV